MKPYYTDKAYKELQKEIVILCTTNEQKNQHIKEWFDKKKIAYKDRALKTGDYCLMLPKNIEQGRNQDIYFTDELFVERKNSIEELASSIKNEAFHHEMKRAQNIEHKFLIIEQENGFTGVLNGDYRNQYNADAFFSTLYTIMVKYKLQIIFCKKEDTARHIATICYKILDKYVEH